MARYADYVKETPIEEEIVQAERQEQVREDEAGIPDRFKGKTRAEIAASYVELEKLNSRQAQDLGAYRKTVDTLLELQPDNKSISQEQKVEPSEPVTAEVLYDEPDKAIRRVAREETAGQLKGVQEDLIALRKQAALQAFDASHPGWRDTANSPEFINWVREAPFRLRLAAAADQYDLDAADALLSMYGDMQARRTTEEQRAQAQQKRERDLSRGTLESSGPIPHEQVQTFSRLDLMNRRLAAKRGNQEQEQWLRVNAAAIREAYADNRITD